MLDTPYVFSSFLAFLTGCYAIYFYGLNSPRGKVMLYIVTGIFLWFIAETIWVLLDLFMFESPYPSIADIFFILAYPLIFIGLVKEVLIGKINWNAERIVPIFFVASLLSFLVFYFGVYSAYDPSTDGLSNMFSIFYGVGDLFLLIVSALIVFIIWDYRKGKLFLPWLFILLGFFSILVADIIFSIYEKEYIEGSGGIIKIDLLWTGGYLLLATGFSLIAISLKEMRLKILENLTPKLSKKQRFSRK